MKITFLGLSSFLVENISGSRLLIDPYNDTPEYSLGLNLPKDLQADLFLVSHPDEDHSYLKSIWTRKKYYPNFPDLNLRGTLVKEHAGDLNIAYSFTVDGWRFLHTADNANVFTQKQLDEIGKVDVLFISPPKVPGYTYHIENIKSLNPKIVIPFHHIPPRGTNINSTKEEVREKISRTILQDWITNPNANEKTVDIMTDIFFEGEKMKEVFPDFRDVFESSIEIEPKTSFGNPTIFYFRNCLGIQSSSTEI